MSRPKKSPKPAAPLYETSSMRVVFTEAALVRWPDTAGPLTWALARDGWDVVVVGGHACNNPRDADVPSLLDNLRRRVEVCGATYSSLQVFAGRNPAELGHALASFCLLNGVNMLFSYSAVTAEVRRRSPMTVVMEGHP